MIGLKLGIPVNSSDLPSFYKFTFTNHAIADLSSHLLSTGCQYILTGRLQTDPLERRFSHYRQMSGGRFLVSLTEVMRSESIISLKTILKNELRVEELTSSEELDDEQVSKFISEARFEDHESMTILYYRTIPQKLSLMLQDIFPILC